MRGEDGIQQKYRLKPVLQVTVSIGEPAKAGETLGNYIAELKINLVFTKERSQTVPYGMLGELTKVVNMPASVVGCGF